ncbi:MAG: phage tail protein [Novosphingobium sp.]
MATLVFTAVGTALGGPLGGLVGGLVGQQVDAAIFGSPSRKGPRLDDLRVTTSSYGSSIARLHGTIRAPGTIIWSTDLVEHSNTQGGGKSGGSVTTYSYSVSFAVALSSRPIEGIGRIWADGNLLRGTAGDLKVAGTMRLYTGQGDQQVDPLIASSEGTSAPAHRGTAYVLFEDLDLTNFGNRIPTLSFEIIADTDEPALAAMMGQSFVPSDVAMPLAGLGGFAHDGGSTAQLLSTIDSVYPLAIDSRADALRIFPAEDIPATVPVLPEPATSADGESFGSNAGTMRRRLAADTDSPKALRYFDIERDYLAGLQRADGRAKPGRERTIEFPGAFHATDARALASAAAERAGWARETVLWRVAELDPVLSAGSVVRLPDRSGLWRIMTWEWRADGIELELLRLPHIAASAATGDSGLLTPPTDLVNGPTILSAFELPPADVASASAPLLFAAVSSASAGWTGAALYADMDGELVPLSHSGKQRSITGVLTQALASSAAALLERTASLLVTLDADDFALTSAGADALANGANRALIGGEVIQFADATPLGNDTWRLDGLLRGRGATEAAALAGHSAGARFVLLDDSLRSLDPQATGSADSATIVAVGLADSTPVTTAIANPGLSVRPLCPVHPCTENLPDGSVALSWVRRARGAWSWLDGVDTPLVEPTESYLVGLGPISSPFQQWQTSTPTLTIDAVDLANLSASYPGAQLWVRQVGSFALSDPLLLMTLL